MGAKDSKPSFISYEDAVKRVSDSELKRIREAFKKCAGTNGSSLSLEAFVREVLCDGVPYEVAEWLYQACGGTKRGIIFRDLLCGVVVLTKGTIEEKIKFLWTLYINNQNENGTNLNKWDFARALHLENNSLPVTRAPKSAEILTSLFGIGDKVTFDQFRSWLLIHKDATVLSKWLLCDFMNNVQDLETPTFYQSLAGVTHLEEADIIELEKCFWALHNSAPTGQLDIDSLSPLLCPPLPKAAVPGVFAAFDENGDGHVDFKELCCGLSAACRGPRTERLKFCFKIFDLDRDGVLNRKEIIDMVGILCTVANESKNHSSRASTPLDGNDGEGADKGFDPEVILQNLKEKLVRKLPKDGSKPIFQLGPTGAEEDIIIFKEERPQVVAESQETQEGESNGDIGISSEMTLTLEDFLIWAVESAEWALGPLVQLVLEAGHIVLGLRPLCRHQERDIVLGWLRREVQRGYSVGQFWYLVSMEWWQQWLAYGAGGDTCCRAHRRQLDDALLCDDSFTSNSTESMGSLLWRGEADAESASLGSGSHSSSGVSSGGGAGSGGGGARRPPPVDNSRLRRAEPPAAPPLTGEGGVLRRDVTLAHGRDFELLPDKLWRAIAAWYGALDPLPRQVIRPPNSDVELELYPLHLKLLRHVSNSQRSNTVVGVGGMSVYSSGAVAGAPPERHLAYTAAFSRRATVRQVSEFLCGALGLAREDMRLWALGLGAGSQLLLDDERPALEELRFDDRTRLLIEVRNADLTWPEEIGALSMSSGGVSCMSGAGVIGAGGGGARATQRRETLIAPDLPGATGLHNLGNTCFMNAALQAVWNTGPLTRYFNSGMHLYEVNVDNPLGTGGALALRFGELCKEVWSCSARSVAPLRVRWCVSRHARSLAGGGQHDAQELLAWLLDALHEDLNRRDPTAPAPPAAITHTPDAPGADTTPPTPRPDQVEAAEAWEQHKARNDSIMTELFYGQLKSKVRCDTCGRESVRFDAFNMLSLPLPMESCIRCDLKVILLDGSVPIKYGVRVNSEGTYLDVKKKLSVLCGLPPESMLIVELSGSMIGRIMEDSGRISLASAMDLYVYEMPREDGGGEEGDDVDDAEDACTRPECDPVWVAEQAEGSQLADSLEGREWGVEKTRSELLISQSPPSTFTTKSAIPYTDLPPGDYRSNTLPKDLSGLKRINKSGNRSPTLSVKSLNVKPTTPKLGKVKFSSSPSDMYKMNEMKYWRRDNAPVGKTTYLVAVHRKQCRRQAYFLASQRCASSVFGVPLLVAVREALSGRALYAAVWTQLARLLSARPNTHNNHNHATDCDDSLGYEFPFTLRAVGADGAWCARCAWPALCRGCALPCDDAPLLAGCRPLGGTPRPQKRSTISCNGNGAPDTNSPIAKAKFSRQSSARLGADTMGESGDWESCGELRVLDVGRLRQSRRGLMLAIDWDPTALHLRYQTTREKAFSEHESVAACREAGSRGVDLASCLRAFTSPERLEQRYHCDGCRSAQPATKTLQIWRAPPIMVIHLKRFQYVNNKWIKSQKVVNFPFHEFDPTPFLAAVPRETILRHSELKNMFRRTSHVFAGLDEPISESDSEGDDAGDAVSNTSSGRLKLNIDKANEIRSRERLESTSLTRTPVVDDNLVDYHQHRLQQDQDPFDLKYSLYAVVSHSGQLSGGHYVSYARNPSGAWLAYNDSMCRELPSSSPSSPHPPLDPAAAYLLFYERRGLDAAGYMPSTAHRQPAPDHLLQLHPDETDLKKMCRIV